MATAAETAEKPLTAEDFARRPDPGHPEELVKGKIVSMPPPGYRHGLICLRIGRILGNFVEDHELGQVVSESGVITERGPDSVRGPDISFYSNHRLPKGEIPEGYARVLPDLVFEVLSPSDRWPNVLARVAEYLNAGVDAVCVVDPERRNLHLYEGEMPVRILAETDTLAFTQLLPGFRVDVARLLA